MEELGHLGHTHFFEVIEDDDFAVVGEELLDGLADTGGGFVLDG